MYHPSVEGILHTSSAEDIRATIHHADLCMTSENRITLLWQAFCAATAPGQKTISWHSVKCISIVLLEELGLAEHDPNQLGVACGRALLRRDADLECFTCLLQYSLQHQSSPAIRTVVCWCISTLSIHMHKAMWETVVAHLPQICLSCPLLLVWYWLLHCYEYSREIGAGFLNCISSLADSGVVDVDDYDLLKSLTYTALLADQPVFPFNRRIQIVNLPKEALFLSDGEFIMHVISRRVLDALTRYPGGAFHYMTFLSKFEYVKRSTYIQSLFIHNSVSCPLTASLLTLIRQLIEHYTNPYLIETSMNIEFVLQEAVFSLEHIEPALLALQTMDTLPSDCRLPSLVATNNFWVNPLCKASWKALSNPHQYQHIVEILLTVLKHRLTWSCLKPWLKLFASVAGHLLFDPMKFSSDRLNWLHTDLALIEALGAVHPILPLASLAYITSRTSTESIASLTSGIHVLSSCGWVPIFLKEGAFSQSAQSMTEAIDERAFVVDTFYTLLHPVFSYPLAYMGAEMQLFDSLMVQGLLRALVIQTPRSGINKGVIKLTKAALVNEWLTAGQWKDIVIHAYQVLRAGANLQLLKDLPLLEFIVQTGLFISDLYSSKKRETIDYLLDQLSQWYGDFHSKEKAAAVFAATSIKRCIAKLETSEEKADTCLRVLSYTKDLNDITLATIDIILTLEGVLSAPTRDRLALALEKYNPKDA